MTAHELIDPALIEKAACYVKNRGAGPECWDGPSGLLVIRHSSPTPLEPASYEPSLCLILQGRKEVRLGSRELEFTAGDAVIVSHHVPLLASVTGANEARPFVSLALKIDLSLMRALRDELGEPEVEKENLRALEVGETDEALFEAIERLFDLVDRPLDAKILAPLIRREIHFRLLVARHGRTLRQLLQPQSHASQISRAMAVLRRDYSKPLSISELAQVAAMSPSSFHRHFKSLTATTPLQFQKSMRLLEARHRLRSGGRSVTEVAFDVGYQSPTQFSREYSRHFGHAPRVDLATS